MDLSASPLIEQVEVVNPELYMYDGEVIAKAEEMGKPGLVTIKQKQVCGPASCVSASCVSASFVSGVPDLVACPCCPTVLLQRGPRIRATPELATTRQQQARRHVRAVLRLGRVLSGTRGAHTAPIPTLLAGGATVTVTVHSKSMLSCPPQDTFIFRVEGTGVLRPEDIVITACELLEAKIRNLHVSC